MVAISALDALQQSFKVPLSTGSVQLDRLLGGGIQPGTVTEICGMAGLGKTQLAMQLSAFATGKVIYIDTEGSFIPKRMQQIAQGAIERHDLLQTTWNIILGRIEYLRVHSLPELMAAVNVVGSKLDKEEVKLVIVDSIAFHFRSFTNFQDRTRILNTLAQQFRRWASENDIAVVLTNQMTTKIGSTLRLGDGGNSVIVPALGESWAHACTNRLVLLWRKEKRSAWLCKSSTCEEGIVDFQITV